MSVFAENGPTTDIDMACEAHYLYEDERQYRASLLNYDVDDDDDYDDDEEELFR